MSEISKYFEKQVIKFDSSKINIFFTSDTHFEHERIIEYCRRPFKDKNEMTEALIKNWNDLIGPDDIVFHLGDFSWGGSAAWNDVLNRLNGHIHLVLGNHHLACFSSINSFNFNSTNFLSFFHSDSNTYTNVISFS